MPNPIDSPTPATLSVTQLNRQARSLLESHFDYVWVEGEISNFAAPGSGHWYFSLKDGGAQVRCAMFRNRNQRLRFRPENGGHIRLRARVSLYEGRGEFQLIVEHMEEAGTGALLAAFEKLKARLLAEGLFEAGRKRPLPGSIRHVGVITSATGAAIHDILTVLRRRSPDTRVSVFPVPVQGSTAAGEIAAAIARANRWQLEHGLQLDVLLVGRGGGSLEDLWAFNEEAVARAIAASELPVVSAVGHEVDFSIADMAADVRAATPSAAAELLSDDQAQWRLRLLELEGQLQRQIRRRLVASASELSHWRKRLKHPGYQLREQAQRLDELEQRLSRAQQAKLRQHGHRLALLQGRLHTQSPQPLLRRLQDVNNNLSRQLEQAMRHRLSRAGAQLGNLAKLLDSVSPLTVLQRGYAIVSNEQGEIIKDTARVRTGDTLAARLARGSLSLRVEKVYSEPEQDRPEGDDNQQ